MCVYAEMKKCPEQYAPYVLHVKASLQTNGIILIPTQSVKEAKQSQPSVYEIWSVSNCMGEWIGFVDREGFERDNKLKELAVDTLRPGQYLDSNELAPGKTHAEGKRKFKTAQHKLLKEASFQVRIDHVMAMRTLPENVFASCRGLPPPCAQPAVVVIEKKRSGVIKMEIDTESSFSSGSESKANDSNYRETGTALVPSEVLAVVPKPKQIPPLPPLKWKEEEVMCGHVDQYIEFPLFPMDVTKLARAVEARFTLLSCVSRMLKTELEFELEAEAMAIRTRAWFLFFLSQSPFWAPDSLDLDRYSFFAIMLGFTKQNFRQREWWLKAESDLLALKLSHRLTPEQRIKMALALPNVVPYTEGFAAETIEFFGSTWMKQKLDEITTKQRNARLFNVDAKENPIVKMEVFEDSVDVDNDNETILPSFVVVAPMEMALWVQCGKIGARVVFQHGNGFLPEYQLVDLLVGYTRNHTNKWFERAECRPPILPTQLNLMLDTLFEQNKDAFNPSSTKDSLFRINVEDLPRDIEDLGVYLPQCIRSQHKKMHSGFGLDFEDRLRYIGELSSLGYTPDAIATHFTRSSRRWSDGEWRQINETIYSVATQSHPAACAKLQFKGVCPFTKRRGVTKAEAAALCVADISKTATTTIKHPNDYIRAYISFMKGVVANLS